MFYKSLEYEATALCLNSWQAGRCGTADQVIHAVVLFAMYKCSAASLHQAWHQSAGPT